MIQIPYTDIIQKIKEKANLSEEEIDLRIKQKLRQLSGLISKEGAAHIVANELGVKLLEKVSGRLQIKNILTGMRDVETVGRVVAAYEPRTFQSGDRSGKVGSFILGDETGTIRVVCWGSLADNVSQLKENLIVKILGGYVRERNSQKEVHLNERGKLILNPPGETVGEVKFTTKTSTRKNIKDLQENDSNVTILGTVVQTFEPHFFEICPECGKRLRQSEEKFICDVHNVVTPDFSYVLNLFLDDGTENIRVVCFRDQADALLKKTRQEILQYKTNPEKFEEVKTALLGTIVKFSGRVVRNTMFDRLEFISQQVDPNPDPEEEIARLNKQE
jgi:replication factor A1